MSFDPSTVYQLLSVARAAAAAIRAIRELADPVRAAVQEALLDDGEIDSDEAAEIGRLAAIEALDQINARRSAADRPLLLGRYAPDSRSEAAGYAGALIGVLVVGRG